MNLEKDQSATNRSNIPSLLLFNSIVFNGFVLILLWDQKSNIFGNVDIVLKMLMAALSYFSFFIALVILIASLVLAVDHVISNKPGVGKLMLSFCICLLPYIISNEYGI